MATAKPKQLSNHLLTSVLPLVVRDGSFDLNLTVPSELPGGKAVLFGLSGRRSV